MSSRLRRALPPVLFGVVGVAILIALGVWQVQRLEWKEALISEIEARLSADPVAIPAGPDPSQDRFLRVEIAGTLGETEIHALDAVRQWGPGYRIVVPVTLDGGRRVMVDLGFVPQSMKDPAMRDFSVEGRDVTIIGLLDWPRETDDFVPPPDRARNIWFAREVADMAGALGTEPILVVAETHGLGDWPLPRPPGTDVPNRHLEYAITWFGLAVAWAVMAVIWLRAELTGRRPGSHL